MLIGILANSISKSELEEKGLPAGIAIKWETTLDGLLAQNADVFMDLLFHNSKSRIQSLESLQPKPVIVNSVTNTLSELSPGFIRVNGWPGFLKRGLVEVAVASEEMTDIAASLFSDLNWPFRIVPDEPGLISARVVAMIVNEAYFALEDGVSTKAEIDLAMKLGTNYPYGPFEWSQSIGLKKIFELLLRLGETDNRYQVANLLREEALRES